MRPQSEYSTFGNFNPSGAGGIEDKFDEIREKGHNVAPSISSNLAMNLAGYGSGSADNAAASSSAVPPSELLSASNGPAAAGPQLHERPKYVFGQEPSGDPGSIDDPAQYSAHPSGYDQEAYGYPSGSEYQDAERAYQQAAGGYYDQNGYYYPAAGAATGAADANAYAAGVGQYYDYSQYPQQQQHQQQGQAQGGYGAM